MFAIAVGAFDLEAIHIFHRRRVAQDVVVAAPEVAAEKATVVALRLAHVEDDLRGPENVSGIAESDGDTVQDREGTVVVDGHELADSFLRVFGGIERLDGWQTFLRSFFGDILGVGALDLGGIFEHDRGQVARGERAVDVPGVTLAAEVRQIAAVVDVRVAEDDGIQRLGVEGKVAVPLDGFVAFALEQSALEQEPLPVYFEKEHRAGRGAGGAEEVDFHGVRMAGEIRSSKFKVQSLESRAFRGSVMRMYWPVTGEDG